MHVNNRTVLERRLRCASMLCLIVRYLRLLLHQFRIDHLLLVGRAARSVDSLDVGGGNGTEAPGLRRSLGNGLDDVDDDEEYEERTRRAKQQPAAKKAQQGDVSITCHYFYYVADVVPDTKCADAPCDVVASLILFEADALMSMKIEESFETSVIYKMLYRARLSLYADV